MITEFKLFENKFFDKIKKSIKLLMPVAILVRNENEYLILMKYLEKNGYHWGTNKNPFPPTSKNYFSGKDFCVFLDDKNIIHGTLKHYYNPYTNYLLLFVDEFMSGNYDSKEYKKKKEELNLKYKDIDPYSEEDWEDMSEKNLIKLSKPKIGTQILYVFPKGSTENRANGIVKDWGGLKGKIINYDNGRDYIGVEFEKRIDGHTCNGTGRNGYCFNVPSRCIFIGDDEEYKKILKKREDIRLKHIEEDPYGEEDWDINENYKILKNGETIESEKPGIYGGYKPAKIFGKLSCKSGMRMKKQNRVFFHTLEDAVNQGYRPCKNCKPIDEDDWDKIKHLVPECKTLKEFYNK